MNIFSLRELLAGHFDRNPLTMVFNLLGQSLRGDPTKFYNRFQGKSKTFKKNKRRGK